MKKGNVNLGGVAVIKGSAFVNLSSSIDQSEISEIFFREIQQRDVVQKEFSV
jgi:hypothetical protein